MQLVFVQSLTIPNEIVNCYTSDSYLSYSEDQEQMTLYLVRSNNSDCTVFPPGVQFNLTFGSMAGGYYTSVIREYSYFTTDEVVFNGVTALPPLFACYIRLFDYGYYSDFEIFMLQREMSDLQNCFSSVLFNVLRDSVRLDLTPTGMCSQVFDPVSNELSVAKVVVENQDYALDKTVFYSNYDLGLPFSITTNTIPKAILYNPFITAALAFDLSTGGRTIEFSTDISDFVSYEVPGIIPSATIGQWGDKFFVRAEPSADADIPQFLYLVGVYDEVDYRVSFRSGNYQFKYLLRFMGPIENQRGLYTFDCLELDSPAEIASCLYFSQYMAADAYFDMVFDIIFKYQNEFLIRYYQALTHISTCWKRAVQMLSNKRFCVDIEWNNKCPQSFRADVKFVKLGEISTGIVDAKDTVTVTGVYFQRQAEVCTEIGDNSWLRNTRGHFIEMQARDSAGNVYLIISDALAQSNYFVANAVAISVGAAYIAFVLATTVQGIVTTVRSLYKMKRSGAKR